jgi:hypothetical protein
VASHAARHTEAVRICRSSSNPDPLWSHRTSAQFLTLGPASLATVRGIATIMAVGPPQPEPVVRQRSQWPRPVDR